MGEPWGASDPSFLICDDCVVMAFTRRDGFSPIAFPSHIGIATSEDGTTFTEASSAALAPVGFPAFPGDTPAVANPVLFETEGGIGMFYEGLSEWPALDALGFAFRALSSDD
ncbi:MAG: hypothetical protein AAF411_26855 [Myxococcota bacterium]